MSYSPIVRQFEVFLANLQAAVGVLALVPVCHHERPPALSGVRQLVRIEADSTAGAGLTAQEIEMHKGLLTLSAIQAAERRKGGAAPDAAEPLLGGYDAGAIETRQKPPQRRDRGALFRRRAGFGRYAASYTAA